MHHTHFATDDILRLTSVPSLPLQGVVSILTFELIILSFSKPIYSRSMTFVYSNHPKLVNSLNTDSFLHFKAANSNHSTNCVVSPETVSISYSCRAWWENISSHKLSWLINCGPQGTVSFSKAELQDVSIACLSSVLKVCERVGRSNCEVDGVRFPTNSASSEIFKEEQKDYHSSGLYH